MENMTLQEEINVWLQEYKKSEDIKIKSQLRNLIVLACLPQVKKLSHSLARRSTDPVEDLIQVGSVGLLKAIDQYDENFGTSFKTYANYFITGEILHYLRDKAAMIRAPREIHELSFRINQLVEKLTGELHRSPTDIEIAQALEIPVKKVAEIAQIDRRKKMVSLDQIISSSNQADLSIVDNLVDSKYQDYLILQEDRIMLMEAINLLDNPSKELIRLSFFEDRKQNEIAKQFGVSQMQISRLIKKAVSELFELITASKKHGISTKTRMN